MKFEWKLDKNYLNYHKKGKRKVDKLIRLKSIVNEKTWMNE